MDRNLGNFPHAMKSIDYIRTHTHNNRSRKHWRRRLGARNRARNSTQEHFLTAECQSPVALLYSLRIFEFSVILEGVHPQSRMKQSRMKQMTLSS